ncbi:MAG: hypothetical protein ACI83L_001665, partial [Cryomorphaceae bacterium]
MSVQKHLRKIFFAATEHYAYPHFSAGLLVFGLIRWFWNVP